jgi:siroheme synthase-like protein
VWVNVADDPEACDFHVPAVLRRGGFTAAFSTGGASPALAAWIRDRVAADLPPEIAGLVEVSGFLRTRVRGRSAAGVERFRELFDSGILEDLARRDWEAADRKVARVFGPVPSVVEILGARAMEAK